MEKSIMELPSQVIFANEHVQQAFEELRSNKQEEQRLHHWLETAFQDLEKNAFCGIQIPKRLIPAVYLQKYSVHNLWKYNLPGAWRLLYSVENREILIVSIILEWLTHKEYERKFGY